MGLIDEAMDFSVKFIKNVRDRGLEFTSGRYYAKYMGIVSDTDDPQGQGRVKVRCDVASGRTSDLERWAFPSADYAGKDKGFYAPPDTGDAVWVWFDHGDPTQPRYSGSFWGNPVSPKNRDTSHVPAEFRTAEGAPTARGFKTKAGHGWLFEDNADKGKRFEAWTGEQTSAGAAATKHHRIILTDADGAQEVKFQSFKGHTVRLVDIDGLEGIEDVTAGGFFMRLRDWLGLAEMGTPAGFKISLNEMTGIIEITTAAGNKIEMIEAGSIINIQDLTGNSVKLTPAGVDVTSVVAVNITAAAAVNISAAAAAAITAAGAVSVTGAGMTLASTGGAPAVQTASGVSTNTFTGLKTETFLGGLMQVVLGLWQVTSTIVDVIAPSVSLGTPGTKFVLMDSRFIALFNAHVHPTTAPAVPTGPPSTPATIGLQTTTAVAAN